MQFFRFLSAVVTLCILGVVWSCSNIVVSPGASTDSSSLLAYNADSASMFGELYHYPAAHHAPESTRDVYDWDTGRYLGAIPEVRETFNVVGNVNEYGLSIGETTFGGIENLQAQSAAKIDYGSLIWITLQRSRSAREAIQTMTSLVAQFGYASEGETFSIIDQQEAW
jgi:dipeptidase